MTELVLILPEVLKLILEKKGYRVVRDTDYNWTLALPSDVGDISEPIVIPKRGDLLSMEITMGTLVTSFLLPGEFFSLKLQIEEELKKKAN